jgi:hypothetical protein
VFRQSFTSNRGVSSMSGIHGPGRRTNRSMPRRLICTRELVKRKIRRDRDDKHRCDENQGQVAKCNHVHQEHCRRRKMTERTLRAWRPSLATVQAEGDLLDHESLIIENSMHVTLGVSLSDFVHLRIEPSSKALWSSTKRESHGGTTEGGSSSCRSVAQCTRCTD